MSCPKCDLKLQLEIRFGDDRFLCPRCDTTISVDNRDDGARDLPPFDPGVVIRAVLIATVASTVIIGLPVLVMDAAPSILEAMTRGSFVHWIVWLTTSDATARILTRPHDLAVSAPLSRPLAALVSRQLPFCGTCCGSFERVCWCRVPPVAIRYSADVFSHRDLVGLAGHGLCGGNAVGHFLVLVSARTNAVRANRKANCD